MGHADRPAEHPGVAGILREYQRKIKVPLSKGAAREVVRNYSTWVESPITASTIARASEISEIWQLSFWDAMILAAAEECEVSELLSEDLNDGQIIAGIQVVNPFA